MDDEEEMDVGYIRITSAEEFTVNQSNTCGSNLTPPSCSGGAPTSTATNTHQSLSSFLWSDPNITHTDHTATDT